MPEAEYLRVTVTWSSDRSRILCAFANGESIASLSETDADRLRQYVMGLHEAGWGQLATLQSGKGNETYYFKRRVE